MKTESERYMLDILHLNSEKVLRNNFDYQNLTDTEKYDLAAIFWAEDDCDFSVLSENILRSKIENSLFSTLKKNTLDNKIELADVLRDSLIVYYHKKTNELLEESVSQFINDNYLAAGFTKRRFADNGEIYWSKQYG